MTPFRGSIFIFGREVLPFLSIHWSAVSVVSKTVYYSCFWLVEDKKFVAWYVFVVPIHPEICWYFVPSYLSWVSLCVPICLYESPLISLKPQDLTVHFIERFWFRRRKWNCRNLLIYLLIWFIKDCNWWTFFYRIACNWWTFSTESL